MARRRAMPSITGIFKSVRTTSKLASPRRASAASPCGACSTVWPARSRFLVSVRAMLASSSTRRMRAPIVPSGLDHHVGVAGAGEIDRERGAYPHLARDPDLTAVAAEDRMHHREAEARSL